MRTLACLCVRARACVCVRCARARVRVCELDVVVDVEGAPRLARRAAGVSTCPFCTSKCSFELFAAVNPGWGALAGVPRFRCLYLYFCTSKASKVSTWRAVECR